MTRTIFVEPEQFYLVDEFCDSEGLARINPNFARIIATIDLDTEKIIGIISLQLVLHAEPIWIKEGYQGQGVWREMAEMGEGYLQEMANQGVVTGIYTQPTRDETRAMCAKMGFYECEHPLYVRVFNPETLTHIPQPKDKE